MQRALLKAALKYRLGPALGLEDLSECSVENWVRASQKKNAFPFYPVNFLPLQKG